MASAPTVVVTEASRVVDPSLASFEDGPRDYWVHFSARADNRAAVQTDWITRGSNVVSNLKVTAATAQAPALDILRSEGLAYQPFWISNVVWVRDGTAHALARLGQLPGVDQIFTSETYLPPANELVGTSAENFVDSWGIKDIGADSVWKDFGVTGEGLVVANVDTGVKFDHPALLAQYRGTDRSGGGVDHNYNWFDAIDGSAAPIDQFISDDGFDYSGHGTHTMGTIVGGEPSGPSIGVAPGARWIATRALGEPSDLLEGMEWLLEPLDSSGANPNASLRPNIVNFSAGGGPSNDPFLDDIGNAMAASGIFFVASNGNSGPACSTSSSPGSRAFSYSAGNYDAEHRIAEDSSRGAGESGIVKPDITAPGSDILSATLDGSYGPGSGSSMAAPHVAGAVALLWSAAPDLVGKITETREILGSAAIDAADLSCGGTADFNNVFGEGRLNIYRAVQSESGVDFISTPDAAAAMVSDVNGGVTTQTACTSLTTYDRYGAQKITALGQPRAWCSPAQVGSDGLLLLTQTGPRSTYLVAYKNGSLAYRTKLGVHNPERKPPPSEILLVNEDIVVVRLLAGRGRSNKLYVATVDVDNGNVSQRSRVTRSADAACCVAPGVRAFESGYVVQENIMDGTYRFRYFALDGSATPTLGFEVQQPAQGSHDLVDWWALFPDGRAAVAMREAFGGGEGFCSSRGGQGNEIYTRLVTYAPGGDPLSTNLRPSCVGAKAAEWYPSTLASWALAHDGSVSVYGEERTAPGRYPTDILLTITSNGSIVDSTDLLEDSKVYSYGNRNVITDEYGDVIVSRTLTKFGSTFEPTWLQILVITSGGAVSQDIRTRAIDGGFYRLTAEPATARGVSYAMGHSASGEGFLSRLEANVGLDFPRSDYLQ